MELVDELSRATRDAGVTIAAAESLTSGALSSALGRGDGAGEWFRGGVVAYQLASKTRALGVDPDVDPCSEACARQMAAGARGVLGADVAVSVTGVGGPDEQDGHAPGTVHFALATDAGVRAELYSFDGDPAAVIEQSVAHGLRLLLAGVAEAESARR